MSLPKEGGEGGRGEGGRGLLMHTDGRFILAKGRGEPPSVIYSRVIYSSSRFAPFVTLTHPSGVCVCRHVRNEREKEKEGKPGVSGR